MKFRTNPKPFNLGLWLAYIVSSATLTMFVYMAVQQQYRQSANDPQVQMAEDAAATLDAGKTPDLVVGVPKIDLRDSLAPFLIVTDENFRVLASSGQLDGKNVVPPRGAFEAAKSNTGKDTPVSQENRITWQPASGVREAAVIVHRSGGYVVAARSLREVENREQQLTNLAGITLGFLLVVGLVLAILKA